MSIQIGLSILRKIIQKILCIWQSIVQKGFSTLENILQWAKFKDSSKGKKHIMYPKTSKELQAMPDMVGATALLILWFCVLRIRNRTRKKTIKKFGAVDQYCKMANKGYIDVWIMKPAKKITVKRLALMDLGNSGAVGQIISEQLAKELGVTFSE